MTRNTLTETAYNPLKSLEYSTDGDWLIEPVKPSVVAERLGGSLAAIAIWEGQVPLLNGSDYSKQYWQYVPETPLVTVPDAALPNDLQGSGRQLLLQHDGYMPTGAYKVHGVFNALLTAVKSASVHEVVAASTGNHAAAVALGASALGLQSVIYMPDGAVATKVHNTEQFGGKVIFKDTLQAGINQARDDARKNGVLFIHPYNQPEVISGQGTTTAQLKRQLGKLGIDTAQRIVHHHEPAGGGGVASGNAVSGAVTMPNRKLHIVQSAGAHTAIAKLQHLPFNAEEFDSSVDGAAVPTPGNLALSVLSAPGMVHAMSTVTHAEVGEAMAVCARAGLPCEPAGALAIASALKAMRANDGELHVAHVTGSNTTPQKVQEFATHAYRAHLQGKPGLNAQQAYELTALHQLGAQRQPTNLELRVMEHVGERQQPSRPLRRGSRVASGR